MRVRLFIPWLLATSVLLFIWLPFFQTVVHDLPFGSHSWKQGDCYALAQRYLEDGNWNILVPRTQSLIPTDGRVNTELPVVPYLAAVAARFAGGKHLASIFRCLTLLFMAMAPLGVFGLVWGRTRGLPEALFATVFVASCPILVYYGTGFHPDPGAFGPLILGMTLVLGWRINVVPGDRTVVAGIGLITLAGLMKMSMAPYLLAPAVVVVVRAVRRSGTGWNPANVIRHLPRRPSMALVVSGLLLVTQFVALRILAWGYAPTFFTASPHPFTSWENLSAVMQRASRVWLEYLFTEPQLLVLALGLLLSIVWCFRRKKADEPGLMTAAAALIMVGLFLLFGKQFGWHDYYSIATFYPTAVLLTIRLALEVHRWREMVKGRVVQAVVVLVLLGLVYSMAAGVRPVLERRTTRWYRLQMAWQDDGRELLEACGRRCAGPVAVLGSRPPNLALTYLDRQGYVLGYNLWGGLGVRPLGSVKRLAHYLDARGVRVLVVRRSAFDTLPRNQVARFFELVSEKNDVVLLSRRTDPDEGEDGRSGSGLRKRRHGVS